MKSDGDTKSRSLVATAKGSESSIRAIQEGGGIYFIAILLPGCDIRQQLTEAGLPYHSRH